MVVSSSGFVPGDLKCRICCTSHDVHILCAKICIRQLPYEEKPLLPTYHFLRSKIFYLTK